jgi:hypothetical protein
MDRIFYYFISGISVILNMFEKDIYFINYFCLLEFGVGIGAVVYVI